MSEERAVLAGGCFWGMQDLFRRYDGVISTRVGYSGGDVRNATYRNHGSHAEAIEIIFDPAKLSYRQILEFFFQIHDPSTRNRQGNDTGTSYRSAIYYTSDEQKRIAEQTIADVDASGVWPGKVVTEVAKAGDFGKQSPSIRTISSAIPPAIPAILCGPIGNCDEVRRRAHPGIDPIALTSFELGRLKIIAHVREELDRAGISAESIQCRSGGIQTPPGIARLTVVDHETAAHKDFAASEVEDCESMVVGETWHKIAAFIGGLPRS